MRLQKKKSWDFATRAPLLASIGAVLLTALALSVSSGLWAAGPTADLPTVQSVDLPRYMGRWYEIAALPQTFQQGCFATTADYTLEANGKVKVVNSCRRGSLNGELTTATGRAWVVDKQTNAKLKVSFQWPFTGNYWILALTNNYDYAMVGTPDRKHLWILARNPHFDQTVVDGMIELADWYGFDVSALAWTVHE